MAKLSIVVPVYNVEKYIGEMIESLQRQTLRDIEIILVDDGSPDNSGAICDKYANADPRIKVIHKKNAGVGAARNDGLEAATGEWIIFCDSDDWLETDALEKLVRLGDETSADVVFGDAALAYESHVKVTQFYKDEFVTEDRGIIDNLIRADMCKAYCYNPPAEGPAFGYGGPWNKIVKRKFLEINGIQFDLRVKGIFDDIIYTAYIFAAAKKIAYTHVVVYNYRQLGTSITNSYKANLLEINQAIFQVWNEFMQKYGRDGRYNESYYALVIRRLKGTLGLYFFSGKNTKPMAEQYKELKALIKTEPYRTSINEANAKKLHNSYDKLVWIAAKVGSPRLLHTVYRLSISLKKIGR